MGASVLSPSFTAGTPGRTSETRWIISRRDDLIWFVGPALVGYLALGLMSVGVPLALLTALWLLGVDGPHVTGTVTRTYFDTQERRRLGWLLWVLVPLLFVGPAAVYLGQGSLFFLFAVCSQHYHITKQHVGFVMLLKSMNRERGAFESRMDRWYVLASGVIPLGLFVVKTRLAAGSLVNILTAIGIAAFAIFTAAYAIYQLRKWRAGKPMNVPKLLLLGALVPLQWLAFEYAARFGPDGIVRAGIALGLFHSLQYHRLIWFHNKNRYQTPDARAKHGLAAVLAEKFGYYFAVAVGLYFVAEIPPAIFPMQWLPASVWGINFMHYFLDSKIWRVRGDKELAAALHL